MPEIVLAGKARSRWQEAQTHFGHLLPPFPGPNAGFIRAKLPPPALLDDYPPAKWPLRLVRSYRSAVAEWFGPCLHVPQEWCQRRFCWVRWRLDPDDVGNAFLGRLERAATSLQQQGISPIAWAAFSCEAWTHWGPKSGAKQARPTIEWVFSPQRCSDRTEWFVAAKHHTYGGTLYMSDPHKELVRAYACLRAALSAEYPDSLPLTEALVRDAVSAWLDSPSESWRVRYARVAQASHAIASRQERKWLERLRRDEWLSEWG